MNPIFSALQEQLVQAVPFAGQARVSIRSLQDGHAVGTIPAAEELANHLGTVHAGALFTLGETISGAAVAGAFADVLLSCKMVAAGASISYQKPARGEITAEAVIRGGAEAARQALAAEGISRFHVEVTLRDASSAVVASLDVDWRVSVRKKEA